MITALYFKRNRPCLRALVCVLLVSWISLTISATCTMPMPSALKAMSEHMQGCSGALKHSSETMQDCSFKPCLDSQANPLTDSNRLSQPDLAVFIAVPVLTFLCLLLSYPSPKIPPKADPPLGRRVLLIYRFCTLLN